MRINGGLLSDSDAEHIKELKIKKELRACLANVEDKLQLTFSEHGQFNKVVMIITAIRDLNDKLKQS